MKIIIINLLLISIAFSQTKDKAIFTTKELLIELKQDIKELKTELKNDITNLKTELKSDITNLKTELKSDITNLKTELKSDITNLKTELKSDITNLKTELKGEIKTNSNKIDTRFNQLLIFLVLPLFIAFLPIIIKSYKSLFKTNSSITEQTIRELIKRELKSKHS